jgi:hypothetical protein
MDMTKLCSHINRTYTRGLRNCNYHDGAIHTTGTLSTFQAIRPLGVRGINSHARYYVTNFDDTTLAGFDW